MNRGWILDTGAVYNSDRRNTVVRLLPEVRRKGLHIVLPEHVFLELARQEVCWKRKQAAADEVEPTVVSPHHVVRDLRNELNAVKIVPFSKEDVEALLSWLDTVGAASWEQAKLERAVSGGWKPIREAFLDLPCHFCGHLVRSCGCPRPIWRTDDRGERLQAAYLHAKRMALAGTAHASATMDWLTVAMAKRHVLTPVTGERHGAEWAGLQWIHPDQLEREVMALP